MPNEKGEYEDEDDGGGECWWPAVALWWPDLRVAARVFRR